MLSYSKQSKTRKVSQPDPDFFSVLNISYNFVNVLTSITCRGQGACTMTNYGSVVVHDRMALPNSSVRQYLPGCVYRYVCYMGERTQGSACVQCLKRLFTDVCVSV